MFSNDGFRSRRRAPIRCRICSSVRLMNLTDRAASSGVAARGRADPDGFYAGLSPSTASRGSPIPAIYAPLPEGWVIGLSDIVRSTAAIEAGRYKTVNTAAASVIAAIANALGDGEFPFVFGGDGASFVLPPEQADLARSTLAAVAAWVRDDLGLTLRESL